MRKLMFALVCLALPFAFWSCEDTEELIGAIDITIGTDTYNIPNAFSRKYPAEPPLREATSRKV